MSSVKQSHFVDTVLQSDMVQCGRFHLQLLCHEKIQMLENGMMRAEERSHLSGNLSCNISRINRASKSPHLGKTGIDTLVLQQDVRKQQTKELRILTCLFNIRCAMVSARR